MKQRLQLLALIFATAFFSLMFELIVSKVANFHLDFRNSYLALPIAFLGLALGSLHVHFRPKIRERFTLFRSMILLAATVFITFMLLFAVFTQLFAVTGVGGYQDYIGYLLLKSFAFVALLILPFYVFGRILTCCFHLQRENIGAAYGLDFTGAALACLLTPLLFHYFNLPGVIAFFLAAMSLLLALSAPWTARKKLGFLVALILLDAACYAAIGWCDRHGSYLYYATEKNKATTREIASRWNEFSRVQLVQFQFEKSNTNYYKIIHDNARSNVHVRRYTPNQATKPKVLDALESPFILGKTPKRIMVMFAGCGAEMIQLNELTAGQADITGIEINRACVDLATQPAELADYHIADFFNLPNIHMNYVEGRAYLDATDDLFDVIFVGSSAPTALAFTGDTRKYLYTKEALTRYLERLEPGGMLLFNFQPTDSTIQTLKSLFKDLGRDDFAKCVVLLRSQGGVNKGQTDLLVKPDGFSPEDIAKLSGFSKKAPELLRYAPGFSGNNKNAAAMVEGPETDDMAPVDDRPFLIKLDFKGYRPTLDQTRLEDPDYYLSWLRITTLIVLTAVTAFFTLIALFVGRERRLSPVILTYLLITGFAYLLIEVVFIAKLELFLQNALVSMASVISIFLIASALGSGTYQRVAGKLGMIWFPVLTAATTLLAAGVMHTVLPHLMGLPLIARLVVTALVIGPVGWLLGMFYPYAVSCLVRHNHNEAVPITYGISTLASVFGASFAMTLMLEWGFMTLLVVGVCSYFLLPMMAGAKILQWGE